MITVDQIMSLDPCPDYPRKVVTRLWAGRVSLSLSEILDLDIPASDRVWAVSQLLPKRQRMLFSADCAESVLHIFEAERPDDMRVRGCIEAVRNFAYGRITKEKLKEAGVAAEIAACACDAGWSSAMVAESAVYAAMDAPQHAAQYAARATNPGFGVRAVEHEKQLNFLRRYVAEIEGTP
jgi:hypothetical protein